MPRRRVLLPLVAALLVGTLFLWSRSPDRSGRTYRSLDALKTVQKDGGYVPVGFFGDGWPATVVEVRTGSGALTITRRDGSRHSYQGFEGYRLKVVHLEGPAQKEVIVVFRSEAPEGATEIDESRQKAVRRI
jgi:hypothetical protein